MKQLQIALLIGLLAMSVPTNGFPSVAKIGDTTVTPSAMTLTGGTYGYAINGLSFQQNPLVTHNGWQYITYYNAAGHVCVGRRQLPSGSWAILELTDYTIRTTGDAHNIISMGICPNDGTIHLSFDHHVHPLNYRISKTGVAANPEAFAWDASLFYPIRNYLEAGKPIPTVTYPRFWQTPGGDLQFSYRANSSGNGDIYMVDYTASTGLWSHGRQVINRYGSYTDSQGTSTVRNAYLNGPIGYGPDGKLHATWTWREGSNHDIMYAFSEDGGVTWYNNTPPLQQIQIHSANQMQSLFNVLWTATGLQTIGLATGNPSTQQLIRVDSQGVTVVDLDRYYGIMNQQAQAVDPDGRIHTVMFHCTPETYEGYSYAQWGPVGARRYYHYWRDDKGVWQRNQLYFDAGNPSSYVGQRPKLFIRSNGDAFVIYQSWQNTSLTGTGVYVHDGDLTIQAATAASHWTDWQIIHVEPGPFVGEALADPYRFEDGVLSVMMQDSPSFNGQSTPLRVLDYQLNDEAIIYINGS